MKYYSKDTGTEVKLGDKITITSKTETPFGVGKTTVETVITEKILPELIKHGIIIEEKPLTIDELVSRVGVRLDLEEDMAEGFVDVLWERAPGIALSFLLKEASIIFNKTHKIGSTAWIISLLDGSISSIPIEEVKNWKTIALFATREDARMAKKILKPLFTELYERK